MVSAKTDQRRRRVCQSRRLDSEHILTSHTVFLFVFTYTHYRRLRRTSGSEGLDLLATACGVPDRWPRHILSSWS
jgi:hypothetical protein